MLSVLLAFMSESLPVARMGDHALKNDVSSDIIRLASKEGHQGTLEREHYHFTDIVLQFRVCYGDRVKANENDP